MKDGGETQRFAETQKKRLWGRREGKVGGKGRRDEESGGKPVQQLQENKV